MGCGISKEKREEDRENRAVAPTYAQSAPISALRSPTQPSNSFYRPLDRSRDEIRLLRIFPPDGAQDGRHELDFASNIVRCQLEYESFDTIEVVRREAAAKKAGQDRILNALFADMPGMPGDSIEGGRLTELLHRSMRQDLQASDNLDSAVDYALNPGRAQLLRGLYTQSQQTFEEWFGDAPSQVGTELSYEEWSRTWIWTPLSGNEHHAHESSVDYFALSYPWSDWIPPFDMNHEITILLGAVKAGGRSIRAESERILRQSGLEVESDAGSSQEYAIILNGRLFPVGANLEKALRTLREIPEIQSGTRVWIDALCINQRDVAEKNIQLKMMDKIYGRAARVISWIGEERDRSGDVLNLMNTLGAVTQTEEEFVAGAQWLLRNLDSEFFYRIAQLMSRSYWSRMWIMQEVAMSSDGSIIVCGARRFPTPHILAFGKQMLRRALTMVPSRLYPLGRHYDPRGIGLPVGRLMDGLIKLRDLGDLRVDLGPVVEGDILINSLWFRTPANNNATVPKDLVYGMLSLLPKWLADRITVDTSNTWTYKDVMVDLAKVHIGYKQSLYWILLKPWAPFVGDSEWPSWVPNLGLSFSSAHFSWTLARVDSAPLNKIKNKNKNINYNSGHVHFLSAGDRILLSCTGFFLDVVYDNTISIASARRQWATGLVARPWLIDEAAAKLRVDDNLLRQHIRPLSISVHAEPEAGDQSTRVADQHCYGNDTGLKKALEECFVRLGMDTADKNDSVFDIPKDRLQVTPNMDYFETFLPAALEPDPAHLIGEFIEQASSIDFWGTRLPGLFAEGTTKQRIPELVTNDRGVVLGRLFTTCKGAVGAALAHLAPGDRIYCLFGCPMPVALRPSAKVEGALELVGGIFVSGLSLERCFDEFQRRGELGERVVLC